MLVVFNVLRMLDDQLFHLLNLENVGTFDFGTFSGHHRLGYEKLCRSVFFRALEIQKRLNMFVSLKRKPGYATVSVRRHV